MRYLGLVLLTVAVAASSLTFSWTLEHKSDANFFPEFAGRVLYPSDLLLVAGLVIWAVGWYLSSRQPIRYGPSYVFLPLLILVGLTTLSIIWAADAPQASFTATASRSAFLGWLLGLLAVTLLAWLWRRQARGLVLRLAGIAVLAFTLTTIVALSVVPAAGDSQGPFSNAFSNAGKGLDRFSSSQITTGLEGRGQDLAYSLSIIREALFLGVGAGNYPQELKQNLDPGSLGGIYTPVHNVPLLILAELGILGGVAWALLMLAPLIWIISRRKEPPADLRSLLWVGPLLVLLFEGLWDFPPWSTQDGRVLMMAVLGLWVGRLDSEGIDLKTRVGRFWGGGFQPFLSLSARRMLRSQISSSMPLKRAGQFLRRNRAELGVVFLFLVLALAVTYPLVFQLSSHIAGCCDAWQSYWYIWWTKEFFSLEGGINPLIGSHERGTW